MKKYKVYFAKDLGSFVTSEIVEAGNRKGAARKIKKIYGPNRIIESVTEYVWDYSRELRALNID